MVIVASGALVGAQGREARIEWPYVGVEQTHTKYSTAAEITRVNVDQLKVVWEWEVGELPLPESGTRPGAFQATPIMIDNVVYVSTMYNRVVALDAGDGCGIVGLRPEVVRHQPTRRQSRWLQAPGDRLLARR